MNHTAPEQTDIDKGPSWDRFKQIRGILEAGVS